jgi:zinc transport system ATP-binding protein
MVDGAADAVVGGPARTVDVLALRGASVGYDRRPVLRDVDFTLSRGEVVAVMGPNGSGKSTLVRAIFGLAQLLDGRLHLFGTPAERFRQWYRLGYVPQRHTVAGGVPATVREVVASGRLNRIRPWRRSSAADRGAVDRAIGTVGLAGRDRHPVATLSGGQQRRVLIARALAAEPEVLVLDEPTAGVDAASQHVLTGTLAELSAAGTTVMIVTHELGPMAPLITRTVVVRGGRIGYDGPPVAGPDDSHTAGADHHHPHGVAPDPPWAGLAGYEGRR